MRYHCAICNKLLLNGTYHIIEGNLCCGDPRCMTKANQTLSVKGGQDGEERNNNETQ